VGPKTPRHLILLSGGLDSSAELLRTVDDNVAALFVDYGQVSAPKEAEAATAVAAWVGVPLQRIAIPQLHHCGAGTLANTAPSVGADGRSVEQQQEWFPFRNLLLITVAAMALAREGGGVIRFGSMSNAYADTTPAFFATAQTALRAALPTDIEVNVHVPSTTREIAIAEAAAAGFPLRLTFSCNRRGDRHCWRCTSCRDRARYLGLASAEATRDPNSG
jgi:7-cyano-7-deazaguanine synthase